MPLYSPPIDMTSPAGLGEAFTIMMLLQLVPASAYFLWRASRTRDLVPVFAIVGGLLSGLGEAMLDHLSLIWWPTDIWFGAYTTFGVEVPFYALLGYCLFLGVGSYAVYRQIADGKGARAIWLTAGIFFVADLCYEVPFLNLGLYDYYGPQPLELAGFPMYWPVLNAMVVIVGGWMFWLFREQLRRGHGVGAVLIPPASLGPLIGVAFPVFAVLHADVPQVIRVLTALVVVVEAVWVIRHIAGVAESVARKPSVAPDLARPADESVAAKRGLAGAVG